MPYDWMHRLWSKVPPHRYSRAAEKYRAFPAFGFGNNARYQKYKNVIRHGEGDIAVYSAKAIEKTQGMDDPVVVPSAPPPDKKGALAAIASGIQTAIGWEQQLTKSMGAIPFPKMQALTIGDWAFGLPHAHMHPPNLVPPSTVPICMPSAGPLIKIPILSGAERTKHAGEPAAMCGDMGIAMAPWCGGYVPMFEVFFGSAHVWIEGARAARVLCDVVKFCTFSTPKPSDPPLGPMVGVSGGGVNHVGIGGVPLPSFFSFAVGKAFQGLAKAGGKVFRRLTAKALVDKMLRKRVIKFDDALTDVEKLALERDLYKIASTRTGRRNLRRVNRANKKKGFDLELKPSPDKPPNVNSQARAWNEHAFDPTTGQQTGWFDDAGYMDPATGKTRYGHDAQILHNPHDWPAPGKTTPSDVILNHELNHAANNMEGRSIPEAGDPRSDWGWRYDPATGQEHNGRWRNFEEYETTHVDNAYRRERGFGQRENYADPG